MRVDRDGERVSGNDRERRILEKTGSLTWT